MALSKPIPITTDLKYVTISSLKTFRQCPRKYYYTEVRNLETKQLEIPFFVGSFYHEGLEQFYKGKKLKEILKHVKKEMDKFLKDIFIRPEDQGAVEIQKAIVFGMIEGFYAVYKKDRKKWKVDSVERAFSLNLPNLPFQLLGTIDLLYKVGSKLNMADHKSTASSTYARQTINGLAMNKQFQTYPLFVQKCLGITIKDICYNAVVKPQIRQKKNERFDEFVNRVRDCYIDDPEKYFIVETIPFNKRHVKAVFQDVVAIATSLYSYFENSTPEEISSPDHWYRDTESCHAYFRQCEFFHLCRYGEKSTSLIHFKEREDRYSGKEITKEKKEKPKKGKGKKVKKKKIKR